MVIAVMRFLRRDTDIKKVTYICDLATCEYCSKKHGSIEEVAKCYRESHFMNSLIEQSKISLMKR